MHGKTKSHKKNNDDEQDLVLTGKEERPSATEASTPKKKAKKKQEIPTEADEEAPRPKSPIKKKSKKKSAPQEDISRARNGEQHDPIDEETDQESTLPRPRGGIGPPLMDDFSVMSDEDSDYDPTTDEPRFEYSTAELADSSCRTTNCCLITVAIICLIVAVILSVVMMRVFADKDAENRGPPPTMAPTTEEEASQPGLTLFQLPRETVEENRCPLGQHTSDDCRNTCEDFDCCDPILQASCFHYNPDGCLNYKRCHAITSGIQIPPENLASICSPESIASNREACEDVCTSVSCCWISDVTCYDKFYSCLDYSPCQNLRADSRVVAATNDLSKFCNSAQGGSLTQSTDCEDACKVAECCWSSGDDNCLETDFLACLTYAPCEQLTLPGSGNSVKLPPASIRNDCSVVLINSGATGSCETSCEAGTCCMDAESSCFDQDPLACLAYEPCRALVVR
jgi:hypothetical protein